MLALSSCMNSVGEQQQEAVYSNEVELTVKNQLVVRFDPSVDDVFFLKAWHIFKPEITVLGPRKHGTMLLSFSDAFPITNVLNTVLATKGVTHAQPNYRSFNHSNETLELINH